MDPDTWLAVTPQQEGSWWPVWQKWLAQWSSAPVAPPAMGALEQGYAALYDAPGTYLYNR